MGKPTEQAPLVSKRPRARGDRQREARGLDVELRADMDPNLVDDNIARLGFDSDRIKYDFPEGGMNAEYDPNTDTVRIGPDYGSSKDVLEHEVRHRGFQLLEDMYNEDPEWFVDEYGKEAAAVLLQLGSELQTELRDNPDASFNTSRVGPDGKVIKETMEHTVSTLDPDILRNFINKGAYLSDDSPNAGVFNRGFTNLDRAAQDMLTKAGEPPKTVKRETGTQEASRKTLDRKTPEEEGGFFSGLKKSMGFAEGGLAMDKQMNKMYKEGGLATDGMDIDPVSGNEIPAGSNAKDVRDDVDAKLSEGEYVVPADVVKYFGVSYFEKLRNKAKEGLEEMQEDGRIGGDPVKEDMEEMEEEYTLGGDLATLDGYATGGLVEGMDVDGIIDRVKAAAAKDPSITNMLKAKGIFVQEPQPQGAMQQQAMSGGATPTQAAPPAIEGQDMPSAFAEGGMVYGEGEYNPANYKSGYNPYDHTLGFSIESGGTGRAPSTPYQEPTTEVAAPVCPEGYIWDAELKVCMPAEAPKSRGRGPRGAPVQTQQGNPNSWMDQYDYKDPEELFSQSMEKLGVRKEGAEEEEEKSWLGSLGDSAKGLLSGGLAGGLIGKFMATNNAAQTMANALVLRDMGRDDLADQLVAENKAYVSDSGISLVPEPMRNGDQLYSAVKKEYGANWSTDATQRASSSTGGGGGGSTTDPAPLVSPPSGSSSGPSIAQRNLADRLADEDKAMSSTSIVRDTSDIGGGSGSLVTGGPSTPATPSQRKADEEKKAEEMGSIKKDDGSYDISSWYNKGGLVKPRAKTKVKAKTSAPKGKRGLGKK